MPVLDVVLYLNLEAVGYLGYFQKDDTFMWNGEVWRIAITDHHWIVKGNLDTAYGKSELSYIADSWLLPMKPETSDDEVTEVESIPEETTV